MGTSGSLPDATVSVVTPAVRLFLYDYSGMAAKLRTVFFRHDSDMRNDIKVRALRRRFGNTGYAAWNYLLEVLTSSRNFEAVFDEINSELYADDFGIEKSELGEILNFMETVGLIRREGDRVWSEALKGRFEDEMERQSALSEARAVAGRKGGLRSGESRREAKQSNASSNEANEAYKIREDKIKEDKKREEGDIADVASDSASNEAPSLPSLPCGKIADLWNDICTAYPRCVKVTDRRKTKIRLRLSEMGCGSDEAEALKTLGDLFRRMQASSFLRGDNGRGWQASFDWLFENGSNWVKVTEGNYDDRSGGHRQTPTPAQQQQQPGANITCPIVPPRIGPGEYFDELGRRTYGTGKATVPDEAPPRPSERYFWNASTQQWLLL